MNHTDFLSKMEESLRAKPNTFQLSDRFNDLEGWDSIGALSVIAIIDEQYGVTLDAGSLLACETLDELASMVERTMKKAA